MFYWNSLALSAAGALNNSLNLQKLGQSRAFRPRSLILEECGHRSVGGDLLLDFPLFYGQARAFPSTKTPCDCCFDGFF